MENSSPAWSSEAAPDPRATNRPSTPPQSSSYHAPKATEAEDQDGPNLQRQADNRNAAGSSEVSRDRAADIEGDRERGDEYAREKKEREAIDKVMKWHRNAYYEILSLPENCGGKDIRRAYHAFCVTVHPDKNSSTGAKTAFQRVSNAYANLIDDELRAKHNRERESLKKAGKLEEKEVQQSFHSSAWEPDEDDAEPIEPDDSDDDDDDDDDDKEPDERIKRIYRRASRAIHQLLMDHEGITAKDELEAFNIEIRDYNRSRGMEEGKLNMHRIAWQIFHKIGDMASEPYKVLSKNRADKDAINALRDLNGKLQVVIRASHYPSDWLLSIPGEQSPRQQGERSDGNTDKNVTFKSEPPTPTKTTSLEARNRREPKILGYKPFYRTESHTGQKWLNGCQFIIDNGGQDNPVELVSGQDVERRARNAYLNLPEKERNDIRFKESKYSLEDAENFDKILGFACKPFKTKAKSFSARYPEGYAWVSFKNGTKDIISRTALRKILGTRDADCEIEEFYEGIAQTPPWEIKPQSWRMSTTQKTLESRFLKKRRKELHMDDSSDEESEDDALFVPHTSKKAGPPRSRSGSSGKKTPLIQSKSDALSTDMDTKDLLALLIQQLAKQNL